MANSVDPDQTALVCTVCTCHFVRNFGVLGYFRDNSVSLTRKSPFFEGFGLFIALQ